MAAGVSAASLGTHQAMEKQIATRTIAIAALSLIFSPASYHLRGAIGFEVQHG
jgi:hypothetical protein